MTNRSSRIERQDFIHMSLLSNNIGVVLFDHLVQLACQRRRAMGKRKLNEEYDLEVELPTQKKVIAIQSFADFGLDPRLLQAVAKEKFAKPTPVQSEAIPLALQGRDVLGNS